MSLRKYDGSAAAETQAPTALYGDASRVETLAGTSANEQFWLSDGDKAAGGAGDDTYYFTANNQITELAGAGTDKLAGWQSLDLTKFANIENISVNADKAYAAGNSGDNIVEGGDGAQQLYGAAGQDVLIGGAGRDVFIVVKGEGNDVVQDFKPGEDVIRLKAGLSSFAQVQSAMSQVGADVKIDLGGGDGLILRNVQAGALTAVDFQLELDRSKLGATTFAEEFNGPLSLWDLQSNPTGVWRPDYGSGGQQNVSSYTLGGETQLYVSPYFREHNGDFPVNPFVQNADGTLTIQARYTTNPEVTGWGYGVTSGQLNTRGGAPFLPAESQYGPSFAQKYGYFEMRADLSEAQGTWGAFWLVPSDWTWPPELDILENPIGDASLAWTTAHTNQTGSHTSDGQANFIPGSAQGFHTYGAMWAPDTITWYVDNVEVFRTATPADMNKPMSLIVNLATGGWAGATGDLSNADMKIDYIRAWALPGSTPAPPPSPPPAPPPTYQNSLFALPESGAWTRTILGSAKRDQLAGTSGNDYFDGKGNGDTMTGGAGDDTYAVDNGSDRVVESAGQGVDTVRSSLSSYTLGANVENLKLVGTSAQTGVGNELNNLLVANGVGSTLNGGAGNDILVAGGGPDQLTGGAGRDIFDFDRLPTKAGHVTDFTVGQDMLDLRGLFAASGYSGSNPVADGYVKFVADGAGGTAVYFDADGAAGPKAAALLTTLDHVAPTSLTAQNDWFYV